MNTEVRNIRSHTGLRGFAAVSVVLVHLHLTFGSKWGLNIGPLSSWNWGWPAVDLFFVLSGYILHHVYVREGKPIDWYRYFVARFARIAPLYYLTLFLVPVGGVLYAKQLVQLPHDLHVFGQQHAAKVIANLFMVAGLIDGGKYPANGPSWSISVEMMLYMTAFPVLVFMAPRLGKMQLWLLTIGFTLLLCAAYTGLVPKRIWGWSWVYVARGIGGFCAGFLVCHLAATRQLPSVVVRSSVRRAFLYVVVPTVCLLAFAGFFAKGMMNMLFPLVVLYTASDRGLFCGLFKNNLLQWTGDRSYSIYLWHYPIFCYWEMFFPDWSIFGDGALPELLRALALLAIVAVVASVSFSFFELPAQRFIRRLGGSRSPFLPRRSTNARNL